MNVSAERWAQIKSVVGEAMKLPTDQRESFVERSCSDDLSLQIEVASLLLEADGPTPYPVLATTSIDGPGVTSDSVSHLLSVALGHQYEIIREIGRGGMGAVYLAREKALERLVAIKVLRPELAASPESRERFRREARIAANLSHPGILQLHTFGEITGVWYFVMSYVRGETLADLLRRRGRLPAQETLKILIELADALACAHRYHVVHRDIKPANVLIDAESGRAVLADFGISKIGGTGDRLTASGAVLGTPHYMSPEQTVAGSDIDEGSDIYSLGAVAYTMLCGREPFSGQNAGQVMYARLVRDPEHISSVNPSVPAVLAEIVMKCLARDRLNRWESADILRDTLTDAASGADERLPEGIRDIPSFGPFALAWFIGWSAFSIWIPRPAIERALLVIIALMVPFGLWLHVWLLGGRSVGFAQMTRVALRPPEWWTMYWPQSLRRSSDMWRRLPLAARFCRNALSAFFLFVPGAIVIGELLDPLPGSVLASSLLALEVVTVSLTVAGLIGGYLWSRRQSLDVPDTLRLMIGPTGFSSGWNKPSITRVLMRAGRGVRAPDPADPLDFRRAIAELAPMLPSELDGFRSEALDLADRMAAALQRQSGEVAAMKRDAGQAETERLQSRLAELGEGADDTGERAQLRQLLETELELVWRMRDRLEITSRQSAHRFELLRNLYSVVSDSCLGEQHSSAGEDCGARAIAVCADMRRELEA